MQNSIKIIKMATILVCLECGGNDTPSPPPPPPHTHTESGFESILKKKKKENPPLFLHL